MPVAGRIALKKAAEAARLAEEAQLVEDARRAEELKLAEEEAKKKCEEPQELDTSEGQLRDLMKWLNSIPLSQKSLNRLDRDFSDGALVGEIIAFYCPDLCNAKRFVRYYSTENKLSTWEFLNKKVFPKLGFKMPASTIRNILKPWSCGRFEKTCAHELLIFKLLFKLQEKLGKLNDTVFDYRKQPDNEVSDKNPAEKRVPRHPRPKLTAENIFSKIEIQLANGTYDDYYAQSKKNAKSSGTEIGGGMIMSDKCVCGCCDKRCWTAPGPENISQPAVSPSEMRCKTASHCENF